MSELTLFVLCGMGLLGLAMILSAIEKCVELIYGPDDVLYCETCERCEADNDQ